MQSDDGDYFEFPMEIHDEPSTEEYVDLDAVSLPGDNEPVDEEPMVDEPMMEDPNRNKANTIAVRFHPKGAFHYASIKTLAQYSTLFSEKLASIEEDDDRVHHLNLASRHGERDEEVFGSYLEYLSTGKIPPPPSNYPARGFNDQASLRYSYLSNVFLLGDTLGDPELQDFAVAAVLALYRETDETGVHSLPCDDTITDVYHYTEPGCPLRQLFVDIYIWAGSETILRTNSNEINRKFIRELSAALVKKMSEKSPLAVACYLMKRQHEGRVDCEVPSGVVCCDYHPHEPRATCGARDLEREERREYETDDGWTGDPSEDEDYEDT